MDNIPLHLLNLICDLLGNSLLAGRWRGAAKPCVHSVEELGNTLVGRQLIGLGGCVVLVGQIYAR